MIDEDISFQVVRVLHPRGHLVVVASGAHHSGFNSGYNVAKVVDFAYFHLIEAGLSQEKSKLFDVIMMSALC